MYLQMITGLIRNSCSAVKVVVYDVIYVVVIAVVVANVILLLMSTHSSHFVVADGVRCLDFRVPIFSNTI